MDIGDPLVLLFVYIVVFIIVFFIMRSVWLWYFRVNEVIYVLQDISNSLKSITSELTMIKKTYNSKIDTISDKLTAISDLLSLKSNDLNHMPSVVENDSTTSASFVEYSSPINQNTNDFLGLDWNTEIKGIDIELTEPSFWVTQGLRYCEYVYYNPQTWLNMNLDRVRYGFINDSLSWGRFDVERELASRIIGLITKELGNPNRSKDDVSYWECRKTVLAFSGPNSKQKSTMFLFMSINTFKIDGIKLMNYYLAE